MAAFAVAVDTPRVSTIVMVALGLGLAMFVPFAIWASGSGSSSGEEVLRGGDGEAFRNYECSPCELVSQAVSRQVSE